MWASFFALNCIICNNILYSVVKGSISQIASRYTYMWLTLIKWLRIDFRASFFVGISTFVILENI